MAKNKWLGKGIYIGVIAVSIGICFLGIRSNANQEQKRKVEYAKTTIKNEAIKIQRLNNQISQFYQVDNKEFLVEPLEREKLRDTERAIITLKTEASDFDLENKDFSADTLEVAQGKKELLLQIEDIKNKSDIQKQVTELLVEAPTNWSSPNEVIVINEKTTMDQISMIRDNISKTKNLWSQSITTFLNEMDAQVKQYEDLKQAVDKMEKEGRLTDDASPDNFIHLFDQLDQVKNESLKKDLSDKFDRIDELLKKQETVDSVKEEEGLPSE
ncbi:hypothetical protein [Enterococcus sp. AZ126]|uniref:hypothetical protein n=1 Tax=Enterococcus sp. AZ126 TaxID=2774635 RepID=UPI003F207F1F